MLRFIPSKDVRQFILETGFQLTDMDFATIIFNSDLSEEEMLRCLSELGNKTNDSVLRKQIEERIAYTRSCYQCFLRNDGSCFYETREWTPHDWADGDVTGHFATLDLAMEHSKKNNKPFQISKYQIVGLCKEVITPQAILNPRLGFDWDSLEYPYSGDPIAEYYFTAEGNLHHFHTWEMTHEEEDAVNDWGKARFEKRFFAMPNPFELGDIVRMEDGDIGIVSTSQAEWKDFLRRVENGLIVEYLDASVIVEYFSDSGPATHSHIPPIYLEKTEVDDETKRRLQSLLDIEPGVTMYEKETADDL